MDTAPSVKERKGFKNSNRDFYIYCPYPLLSKRASHMVQLDGKESLVDW